MSNQTEIETVVEVGSVVEGTVSRIKPFGALVTLPNDKQGLVHISHISSSYVENIAEHIAIGDTVLVKIISIEEATGKIALSMKEATSKKEVPQPKKVTIPKEQNVQFEDKFKEFLKSSNERLAGLNKRNKRR